MKHFQVLNLAMTTSANDLLARSIELEKQAQDLHLEAQRLNKESKFEEAKTVYGRMNELDYESLRLCCEAIAVRVDQQNRPTHTVEKGPTWAELYNRGTWANAASPAEIKDRAKGAILGSLLGDSAASGVQWIYNLDELTRIDQEVRGGSGDLTFMSPSRSPFLPAEVYGPGDLSPYGEQTYALLRSAARLRGLCAEGYAQHNFEHFASMAQAKRYRDAATKGFLRKYAQGVRPPGADDAQANCATRMCVVAALMAGAGPERYLPAVERIVRTTQNTDKAVAFASATALVLELMIRGIGGPLNAVVESVPAVRRLGGSQGTAEGAELYARVAHHLDEVVQGVGVQDVPSFTAKHGRNCHMPNSLQTPLFAAVVAHRAGGAPEEIFKRGVRAAVREGGCCASRASVTGAVLGALVGAAALPSDWKALVGAERWAHYEQLAEEALAARD